MRCWRIQQQLVPHMARGMCISAVGSAIYAALVAHLPQHFKILYEQCVFEKVHGAARRLQDQAHAKKVRDFPTSIWRASSIFCQIVLGIIFCISTSQSPCIKYPECKANPLLQTIAKGQMLQFLYQESYGPTACSQPKGSVNKDLHFFNQWPMPPTQDFLKLYPDSLSQTTGAWSDGAASETKALIDGTPEYLCTSVAAPRIRAVS
jgi:hypothetical protein